MFPNLKMPIHNGLEALLVADGLYCKELRDMAKTPNLMTAEQGQRRASIFIESATPRTSFQLRLRLRPSADTHFQSLSFLLAVDHKVTNFRNYEMPSLIAPRDFQKISFEDLPSHNQTKKSRLYFGIGSCGMYLFSTVASDYGTNNEYIVMLKVFRTVIRPNSQVDIRARNRGGFIKGQVIPYNMPLGAIEYRIVSDDRSYMSLAEFCDGLEDPWATIIWYIMPKGIYNFVQI